MNKRFARLSLTMMLVIALTMMFNSVVLASTPSSPTSDSGVVPYIVDNPQGGGNVSCTQLGYDFSSARVNYVSGSFDAAFPAGITVTTDGTYVEWTSTFPIGAVIVKGGNDANVYEYIPASLGDSGLASPPNSSGGPAGLSNLTFCWNKALEVSKTAETSFDRSWTWDIEKTGDQTDLLLSVGQTFTVNYEVTVSATSEDSNWAVTGEITIYNPNPSASATIEDVTDVVSPDIDAEVDCGDTFPITLAAEETLICTYSADLPNGSDRTNTATAETSGNVPGGSDTVDVTFSDTPTNESDECIDVTDDNGTPSDPSDDTSLGTVCADEAPKKFEYTLDVGPYASCGEYTFVNVASFVTNDTDATDSDDHTVNVTVPCAGGCTLTQGYWKTHSDRGPAPYDDAWKNLGPLEEDTLFFKSGKTWYTVFWTPPAGNAFYNLAHQYMAAKLNILNSASSTPAVDSAITNAEALFNSLASGSTSLTTAQRRTALTLAATLDQYNNGLIGPGHCSE